MERKPCNASDSGSRFEACSISILAGGSGSEVKKRRGSESLLDQGASERSERSARIAKSNSAAGDRLVLEMSRAVKSASRTSPCPSISHPLYAFSRSTGKAYAMACGSWACPSCARKKKAIARRAIEVGQTRAFARNERVRFLTLTDAAAGLMSVADLYAAWNRLRLNLKRGGYLAEYAAALEVQERGALHLHLLATGSYLPVRKLSELAARAGFGPIVDIRAVKRDGPESVKNSAAYVAKELAGYVMKDGKGLAEKTRVRRRPVRFSRGWGCSLGAAQKLIAEEMAEERGEGADPGPWVVLRIAPDGTLIPTGGQGLPRAIPPPTEPAELAGRQAQASEGGDGRAAA